LDQKLIPTLKTRFNRMPDRRDFWRAAGVGALMLISAATLTWGLGGGPAVVDALAALIGRKKPDVIYAPTPQAVVERMLELAEVKHGDVVYDLGSGDGRVVVTAAKRYGVKAVGFEIDPALVAEARENARKNGVSDLVTIAQDDLFKADLSAATVITMYLGPALNARMMPRLAKLRPGTRIVSHDFPMKGARPKVAEVVEKAPMKGKPRMIYLWVVPWESE
jgi:SAM-dependent methyltransferase